MQTVVQKAFKRWINDLGILPLSQLYTDPKCIFQQILPAGKDAELQEFRKLWAARFEVIDPIAKPEQAPVAPGWYSVTSRYARLFVDSMRPDMAGGIETSFPDMVEAVVDEWNDLISRGEATERDLVPVLVHFTVDSVYRPGKLWIDHLCCTTYDSVIFLQPMFGGEEPVWALTDRRTSPSMFYIKLPGPGTLPFQRAAALIGGSLFSHTIDWGCEETPLLLEWIFAAGSDDMLKSVDDCLSHRAGEDGQRINYKTARQLVRRARGL